jgi:hypothetical protein
MAMLLGFLVGYWGSALFLTKSVSFVDGYITFGVSLLALGVHFWNLFHGDKV